MEPMPIDDAEASIATQRLCFLLCYGKGRTLVRETWHVSNDSRQDVKRRVYNTVLCLCHTKVPTHNISDTCVKSWA
jgi:hypothetical protein